MKAIGWIVIFAIAGALDGCATYSYDGQKFTSEQDALAYQQRRLGDGVSAITPRPDKIGGILKIFTPNEDVYREKGIVGAKKSPIADYIVKTYIADKRRLKEAFEKRRSFDSVELVFSKGEHVMPTPHVHTLYLYLESPSVAGWYYVGMKVPRTAVSYDRGTKDMGERYKFFIESVEALAVAEKLSSK